MDFSRLRSKLRDRWPDMRVSMMQDVGTMSLGTAAVFLTRAFPTTPKMDFSMDMLMVSTAFAAVGLFLRVLAKL